MLPVGRYRTFPVGKQHQARRDDPERSGEESGSCCDQQSKVGERFSPVFGRLRRPTPHLSLKVGTHRAAGANLQKTGEGFGRQKSLPFLTVLPPRKKAPPSFTRLPCPTIDQSDKHPGLFDDGVGLLLPPVGTSSVPQPAAPCPDTLAIPFCHPHPLNQPPPHGILPHTPPREGLHHEDPRRRGLGGQEAARPSRPSSSTGPKAGEVLVEIKATGICHTDDYTLDGAGSRRASSPPSSAMRAPGIVVEVGAGVTTLKPGDHVIPLYTPECRQCKSCLSRKTNLCTAIRATQGKGLMPDGTSRFSLRAAADPPLHGLLAPSRTTRCCRRSRWRRSARTRPSTRSATSAAA